VDQLRVLVRLTAFPQQGQPVKVILAALAVSTVQTFLRVAAAAARAA
jgi:hypothetical protein